MLGSRIAVPEASISQTPTTVAFNGSYMYSDSSVKVSPGPSTKGQKLIEITPGTPSVATSDPKSLIIPRLRVSEEGLRL